MGEAFKRMRAAAFEHRRHRRHQELVDRDLFSAARETESRFEVTVRLVDHGPALTEGSHCILRERGKAYELVYGNVVVGQASVEANETIEAYRCATPSLNGIVPGRVSRVGPFGGVTIELGGSEERGP